MSNEAYEFKNDDFELVGDKHDINKMKLCQILLLERCNNSFC